MIKNYLEIKNRYKDIMVDILDRQMFNDLVFLLHYIETLHEYIDVKNKTDEKELFH